MTDERAATVCASASLPSPEPTRRSDGSTEKGRPGPSLSPLAPLASPLPPPIKKNGSGIVAIFEGGCTGKNIAWPVFGRLRKRWPASPYPPTPCVSTWGFAIDPMNSSNSNGSSIAGGSWLRSAGGSASAAVRPRLGALHVGHL